MRYEVSTAEGVQVGTRGLSAEECKSHENDKKFRVFDTKNMTVLDLLMVRNNFV